jgi:hypothetical protein
VAQPTSDPYQNLGAGAHRAPAHRGRMRGGDHERIYAEHAAEYDAVVRAKDSDAAARVHAGVPVRARVRLLALPVRGWKALKLLFTVTGRGVASARPPL